ncbi:MULTISPECIES: ribosome biogenesis GTPase YlqF [Dialister]|uniref:ribosome biogenesis GTPase YlqF n=1 Tax=Dialister TaxID=39948 RepID=UPI000D55E674|nr:MULTISPECIES: ribosome biogenesis GTPase YlqF [Dialister]MBS6413250.1 ribosome biogenesis GTPase YlqF [Dialister sp.]MCH3912543.1 ribosome biogenesis GTPase YlqF [Dialister sp.]HJI42984.1 ribosome biogenesis GTPase YlqF [Veillonellaceae bacterium]
MLIQWFPGHMTKTKRMIEEHLKAVDVVAELLDARIPVSSANPMVEEIVSGKPRIIILNKADLANPRATDQWISYYEKKGIPVLPMSVGNSKNKKKLLQVIRDTAEPILAKWKRRGMKSRSVRLMILGIPNVGKSSLINFLAGTAATRTANTPGHTRGKQWVRLSEGLDLLDTPGVLWPKFDDQTAALRLAATGAIAGDVFNASEVVAELMSSLAKTSPEILKEQYNIENPDQDPQVLLEQAGRRRGCLLPGGNIDFDRAEMVVLRDFRNGKLGRITLDPIPEGKDE